MEFRRIRRRYDHRSREIARETGDIELAVTNGVPRSTARDWSCLAESDHARHRSHVRPHSSLSCRPPAPETILSRPPVSASRRLASISILEFNQRLNQEVVSFRGGGHRNHPSCASTCVTAFGSARRSTISNRSRWGFSWADRVFEVPGLAARVKPGRLLLERER